MNRSTGITVMTKCRRFLRRCLRRSFGEPLEPIEGYRRWAATYDAPATVFQELEAEVRCVWLEQYRELEGARVLDLGAGKGRASNHAIGKGARRCVALDVTLAMLVSGARETNDKAHLPAAVGDAVALPFRRGTFDLVIAALIFGHVADLGQAFAQASRVLRPGGSLVVTDFHPAATERGWKRSFEDRSTGTTESVLSYPHRVEAYVNALEDAGFTLVDRAEPLWRDQPVVLALRGRLGAGEP